MATYTPPADVAANARRALEVRATKPPSQQGMTAVGLARANQLANREPLSLDTVQRMVSYFERHEVDKQGSTWDEQGKGWQAWYGWGGDEGWAWARRIVEEQRMETKASRRHSESDMEALRTAAHHTRQTMKALRTVGYDGVKPKAIKAIDESVTLTPRQIALYDDIEEIVAEYGVFDRGIGANGAHYAEAEQNPFIAEGIVCKNCVFFLANRCEIIDGDIEEEAVCKFWIIPEAALGIEATPTEEAPMEPVEEPMAEDAMMTADKAIEDRNTTPAQREEMPAEDFVIPETRNFPVVTPGDIDAAVSSWGRYQGDVSFDEFKQRLIDLATAKGEEFVARLPQAWKDEMENKGFDNVATMDTEAVKAFARRLLGKK